MKTDKNGYPAFYRAAEDAKIKAGVLAKAAGIHIGELVHIDYSWGKVDFEVRPVQDVCFESCGMAPAGGISMDIEPDDMEAEDTVTVVWETKNNAYCMEGAYACRQENNSFIC